MHNYFLKFVNYRLSRHYVCVFGKISMYVLMFLFVVLFCSVRGTIERYKKACAASTNAESVSEANTQVNLVNLKKKSKKW